MNKALLMCGADIKEINTIRKHVSTIKGGRLARKIYPASLVTLVVSDVVGDDLASIASGPTVPDTTSYGECLGIVEKYGLHGHMPDTVIQHLQKGVDGIVEETVRDGDEAFKNTHSVVVANNSNAVKAASARAKEMGYGVVSLPSFVLGDTQDAAHSHVRLAKKVLAKSDPVAPPACIISGGETTVKVRGHGKGGRNQEFVLRAATEIEDLLITVLSVGTDGIDGPTDAAGAICDGKTMARARQLRLKATSCLDNNDSYNFFARLGDLMMTGPTGTNVSDIHIIIIGKPT
jgi:hydroxypyruvate reductase